MMAAMSVRTIISKMRHKIKIIMMLMMLVVMVTTMMVQSRK
jgi:hypothetical protein